MTRKTRTRWGKQTTLTGRGAAKFSPKLRVNTSPNTKRAFQTDSSDGFDDLPVIKPQQRAQLEEPSKSNSNRESLPRSLRKKRKTFVDSDSSQSGVPVDGNNNTPRKTRARRLTKGRRTQDSSEDEEVGHLKGTYESDEEDMVNEVEKDRILETRLRSRDKKTAFQKSLEKLKRRKQKQPSLSSSSSLSEGNNEDDQHRGAEASSDLDSLFDEDIDNSDSSDFIVEDDGVTPTLLPAQFSMEAHQDLSHQFKKIFQFFVHIAVRPAKERHDFMEKQIRDEEYFSVPLQVTRRKISGLRDSLVASSVWRPEFKNPLETYPELDLIPLDFAVPVCDACHLGGRMSTLTGRLSGLPYDKLGFEIAGDPDSDSDDSDSVASRIPTTVEFNLGRFCGRRTRVYHEFTHWEYSLFRYIRQEVDDLHACNQSGGYFRISYSGTKEPPDDLDDADAICDWLDDRKMIDMEWQKIKDMMESARHLEMTTKKGDVD